MHSSIILNSSTLLFDFFFKKTLNLIAVSSGWKSNEDLDLILQTTLENLLFISDFSQQLSIPVHIAFKKKTLHRTVKNVLKNVVSNFQSFNFGCAFCLLGKHL